MATSTNNGEQEWARDYLLYNTMFTPNPEELDNFLNLSLKLDIQSLKIGSLYTYYGNHNNIYCFVGVTKEHCLCKECKIGPKYPDSGVVYNAWFWDTTSKAYFFYPINASQRHDLGSSETMIKNIFKEFV